MSDNGSSNPIIQNNDRLVNEIKEIAEDLNLISPDSHGKNSRNSEQHDGAARTPSNKSSRHQFDNILKTSQPISRDDKLLKQSTESITLPAKETVNRNPAQINQILNELNRKVDTILQSSPRRYLSPTRDLASEILYASNYRAQAESRTFETNYTNYVLKQEPRQSIPREKDRILEQSRFISSPKAGSYDIKKLDSIIEKIQAREDRGRTGRADKSFVFTSIVLPKEENYSGAYTNLRHDLRSPVAVEKIVYPTNDFASPTANIHYSGESPFKTNQSNVNLHTSHGTFNFDRPTPFKISAQPVETEAVALTYYCGQLLPDEESFTHYDVEEDDNKSEYYCGELQDDEEAPPKEDPPKEDPPKENKPKEDLPKKDQTKKAPAKPKKVEKKDELVIKKSKVEEVDHEVRNTKKDQLQFKNPDSRSEDTLVYKQQINSNRPTRVFGTEKKRGGSKDTRSRSRSGSHRDRDLRSEKKHYVDGEESSQGSAMQKH